MVNRIAYLFSAAIILSFNVSYTESLRCLQCLTAVNKACNANPEYSSGECGPEAEGCFSRMIDSYEMVRWCAVDSNPHWAACKNQTVMGCFFCQTNNCNAHQFFSNNTQRCVVCKGEECLTKTELTLCPGLRYYSSPKYCHFAYSQDKLVAKGCDTVGPPDTYAVVCLGQGCNLELPNTYSSCYDYHGEYTDQGYSKRNLVQCHNEKSQYWRPGCYFKAPWKGKQISSGCLSNRQPGEVKECVTHAFRFHCQSCIGDECNRLSLKKYNFTNRCEAPANSEEFCAQLDARCYVTQLLISDGRNGTILQKYAGCLDYGFNPFLLVSPQTHFCDNMRSDVVPCMSIDEDFTRRRSCYQCANCDNVFDLDHRIKLLCPVGTTNCYAVMGRDMQVRRGCDHPSDPYYGACRAYKHVCARCDYDYCNFNTVASVPGQCFKTRPYMHPSHLMTLRLEDCSGRYLTNLWNTCYVAFTGTLFIEAGCVNELQASDVFRYEKMRMGDTSVIDEEAVSCYKCTSNQTDFCYNVRHLEPEPCKFETQYAIRGCYTMLKKDTIQRGCLTELDMYHQHMCANVNFLPICNTCRRSFCNIHVP